MKLFLITMLLALSAQVNANNYLELKPIKMEVPEMKAELVNVSEINVGLAELPEMSIKVADKKWKGTTYGNSLMHHWLIKLLKVIDIRFVYIFTYIFVIPPCLLRPGFKPIYHYFRERWGYGPVKIQGG